MNAWREKRKVFVVHGRDHKARNQLIELLKDLGLTPVVFSKRPDSGKTVIEKFETLGSQCEFAIVLLTPDDSDGARQKARQNVIFEMGWFFAKLGRHRTLVLRKGATELPSNIRGVLYKKFVASPLELKDQIVHSLAVGGLAGRAKKSHDPR